MAEPDGGSCSLFRQSTDKPKARFPFGSEPSASDFAMRPPARLQCFHCSDAVFPSRVSEASSLYSIRDQCPRGKTLVGSTLLTEVQLIFWTALRHQYFDLDFLAGFCVLGFRGTAARALMTRSGEIMLSLRFWFRHVLIMPEA